MTGFDILGFQYSGQALKEVTVIRSMAPINLIVYYPKTEEGQIELAKRVSDVHDFQQVALQDVEEWANCHLKALPVVSKWY